MTISSTDILCFFLIESNVDALLKAMQAKVSKCADELGIAAESVASKRELAAVIFGGTRESRVFSGWRAELVGNELLELL